MKIIPRGDRVLLKATELEKKTEGGIYIPSSGDSKENIGEVVALGNRVEGLRVGDKVVYKEFSGTEVKQSRDRLILLDTKDILGTIEF